MANAMIHWNGNQMCVIDTETTGLEAGWHDLIQICILPLDSNLLPRKDVMPFYLEMIPEHPERADPKAMSINRLDFAIIGQRGHHPDKARDLLEHWIAKLGLPQTRYGNSKKILPLGQNYSFDVGFMKAWLGTETYNDWFHYAYRDTKVAAAFLNDRAGMHAEKVPFAKTSLGSMAKKLNVRHEKAHDALSDCMATAGIYRQMLREGLLG
jgi:DNA polymerase III epsilon subunit-like protein